MDNNLNILFIDDEQKILDGLRRMLRSMRREWAMKFANSADEALRILAEENIDVVVSDMRMPGMDGAAFLGEVRRAYPEVVRIVLSGYADTEMVLSSIGNAHQYLSKPCDAETLKSAVGRAISMHGLMADSNLRKIINRLRSVPSIPSTYAELTSELESEFVSSKKIGMIIKRDPGMTAKVLQLVNSAFFSIKRTVSDPAQAVDLLGTDTISSLVLALGVFSRFEDGENTEIFNETMHQSLAVAELAKKISSSSNEELSSKAFTVGLLHKIGTLILMSCVRDQYLELREECEQTGKPIAVAEHEAFGADHAQIGGYLLSLWGLPAPIIEAVTFHIAPGDHGESEFSCLSSLHLASGIYQASRKPDQRDLSPYVDIEFLKSTGMLEDSNRWFGDYLRQIEIEKKAA